MAITSQELIEKGTFPAVTTEAIAFPAYGDRPAIHVERGARVQVVGSTIKGRVLAVYGDETLTFYRDELDAE